MAYTLNTKHELECWNCGAIQNVVKKRERVRWVLCDICKQISI